MHQWSKWQNTSLPSMWPGFGSRLMQLAPASYFEVRGEAATDLVTLRAELLPVARLTPRTVICNQAHCRARAIFDWSGPCMASLTANIVALE